MKKRESAASRLAAKLLVESGQIELTVDETKALLAALLDAFGRWVTSMSMAGRDVPYTDEAFGQWLTAHSSGPADDVTPPTREQLEQWLSPSRTH